MSKSKTELLIAPIIRYINNLVAKSGQQAPELLPGEMALCEQFKVGRGTVRRALDQLIRQQTVIRLPGRKGYFSNPEQSINAKQNIGILVDSGHIAAMAGPSCSCMRGCLEVLEQDLNCIYFPILHSRNPEECRKELESLQLDALLWIAPKNEYIGVLDDLAESGMVVFSIENPYVPLEKIPRCNSFLFDYSSVGRKQAEYLLLHHCTEVYTFMSSSKTSLGLSKAFAEASFPLKKENFITEHSDMEKDLRKALECGSLQAVIACGPMERYLAVSTLLASHPHGKNVRILVEPEPQSRSLRSRFPELRYEEVPGIDIYKSSYEAGKRAAKRVMKILTGECPTCLEAEYYF